MSEGLASAEDAGRRPSGAGAFRRYTQCPWVGSGVRVRYLAPALSRPALSRAASTVSFRTFVHRALCDRMRGVARLVAPARRPRTCAGDGPLHPRCGESGRPTRCGGSGPKAGAGAGSRSRGRFPFRVVRQPRGPDCAAPAPAFGQPPLLSMAGPSARPPPHHSAGCDSEVGRPQCSGTRCRMCLGAPVPGSTRRGGGPPTVSWHAVPTVWPGRLRLPSARFPLLSLSGPRGRVAARPPTV